MGQATIDLPEPTQLSGVDAGPLSPEALASADDLLSQLAGDDIDRLLAEADADRPSAPAAPAPVSQTTPPAPAPAPAAAITTVEAAASESPPLNAAATAAALDAILAPAIESSLKAVEAQVNAVSQTIESSAAPATATLPVDPTAAPVGTAVVEPSFDALDQKLLNEAAAHVASIMDVPIVLPPAPTEPATPVAATPVQATDTAERQALAEPLVVPHVEKKPSRIMSLLVRILELLNSPMAFLPDDVRDAIGKVAILTTCNAAAVIVYVLVFRRPHH